MTPLWQVPRAGLLWILVAQVAITIPLLNVLPLWVLLVFLLAALWRLQVFRGVWSFPGRLTKLLLVMLCGAGLLVSFSSLSGLEPLTSLLLIAFMLKMLEMHRRRDGIILVFVGYFCSALLLLYEQSIGTMIYSLFCTTLVTAALVGIHQSDSVGFGFPIKKSMLLLAQSIPLMLVLFLVMPRMGAFWSVPLQKNSGSTGVSGEMSPGDLSKLGKNGALAFRVEFAGDTPEASTLYWRGPVLSHFDGRTWRMGDPWSYGDGPHVQWHDESSPEWQQKVERYGEPLRYSVVMEPTQRPWLYGIAVAKPTTSSVGITRELRLVNNAPITSKFRYELESWPQYRAFPTQLHKWQRRQALQLPEGYNPESSALAAQWRRDAASDLDYINRLLNLYNREFVYTLEPPLLGKHSVDEFLTGSKRGFCSHFAGSFVFMMRAAGIPARVVTGYQGAERHPSDNYLLVYQYNAHAWAEVWLPNEGWVRVDPTSAVAPERIESGFEEFFGEDAAFLKETPFSLARFRDISVINQLRFQLDSLNYYWATWVLGYDRHQQSLLERLLGGVSPTRIALLLLICGGVVLLVLALVMLRGNLGRTKADPLDRSFTVLCAKLAKAGVARQTGEGARDYAQRVASSDLQNRDQAARLLRQYEQCRYRAAGSESIRQTQVQQLQTAARRFRPAR